MYKPNDITYPLISWYKSNKRNLPWRNAFNHENAPYQILVSEFMLQQTTVATVLNYYDRFIERWPTNKDLSNATEDEVLEIWSGLGYYSRGTNLLKTSKIIFHDYSNKIPKDIDTLKTFPGVGEYMSSAIASIAYNLPSKAVDTNIQRVITRYYQLDFKKPARNRKKVQDIVLLLTSNDSPRDLIQGLMDLGSSLCTAKLPDCEKCPLKRGCNSYKNNKFEFTLKKIKKIIPQRYGCVYLIERSDGSFLLERRAEKGLLAKTYQFPTTDWCEAMPPSDSLKSYQKMNVVGKVNHRFSHFTLELTVIKVDNESSDIKNITVPQNGIWKKPNQLDQLGLSSLMRKASKYIKV